VNNAENIVALVDAAAKRDAITCADAVRILGGVIGLLNLGRPVDDCQVMRNMHKEVNRKWPPSYGPTGPSGPQCTGAVGVYPPLNFKTLRNANATRQAEWDPSDQITLAYRGNELAGEVGEACNVLKKLERERIGIRGSRATKEQLAEELADVVICVDLIAMQLGIDLGEATATKFNMTSDKYSLQTKIEV
jgi:NTP pyrophosphatase (non-canonical NTP hydrolase)